MTANMYLVDTNQTDITGKLNGVYVNIDWDEDLPERVRRALENCSRIWHIPAYTAKFVIGCVFEDQITDLYGGGIGTEPMGADYPVLVADLANQIVAFAHHGEERDRHQWYKEKSYAEYLAAKPAWPRGAKV